VSIKCRTVAEQDDSATCDATLNLWIAYGRIHVVFRTDKRVVASWPILFQTILGIRARMIGSKLGAQAQR
jgi:hypothetical protein